MALAKSIWGESTKIGVTLDIANDTTVTLTARKSNSLCISQPEQATYGWQRFVVSRMCTRYSPDELQIVAIDMGGNELKWLEKFPHLRQLLVKPEQEQVAALINELLAEKKSRLETFDSCDVISYPQYREFADGIKMPTIIFYVTECQQIMEQEKLDALLTGCGKWGLQAFFVSQSGEDAGLLVPHLALFNLRISNNAVASTTAVLLGSNCPSGSVADKGMLNYVFPTKVPRPILLMDKQLDAIISKFPHE